MLDASSVRNLKDNSKSPVEELDKDSSSRGGVSLLHDVSDMFFHCGQGKV